MKTLFITLVTCLLSSSFAFARSEGPSISGGVSPAPRALAVVLPQGGPASNEAVKKSVLELAAQWLVQDKILAMGERPYRYEQDRVILCIQFKDASDAWNAKPGFDQLIVGQPGAQVNIATYCFEETAPPRPPISGPNGPQY